MKCIEIENLIMPGDHGDIANAINRAIDRATKTAAPIYLCDGQWRAKTRPNEIRTGIPFHSCSGNNSNARSCLIADYDEEDGDTPFLCWENAEPYAGTGGGLFDITILKGAGKVGGTAVRMMSNNGKDQQSGWKNINNVAIHAEAGGSWYNGLVLDGSKVQNPVGPGIRWININGLLISNATHQSVIFNDATFVNWTGGNISRGPDSLHSGFLITGPYTQSIFIRGLTLFGLLDIIQCEGFIIEGRMQNFDAGGEVKAIRVSSTVANGKVICVKCFGWDCYSTLNVHLEQL